MSFINYPFASLPPPKVHLCAGDASHCYGLLPLSTLSSTASLERTVHLSQGQDPGGWPHTLTAASPSPSHPHCCVPLTPSHPHCCVPFPLTPSLLCPPHTLTPSLLCPPHTLTPSLLCPPHTLTPSQPSLTLLSRLYSAFPSSVRVC